MAGKRSATSDLNHDNWDREEEPEESGSFQRASEDSLKRRIIKTARRRNPISSVRDSGDGEKNSAFTSFTAFSKVPPTTSTAFSFLSNLTTPKTTTPKVNGLEDKSEKEKSDISTFKFSSTSVTSSINDLSKSSSQMLSWTKQTETTEKITTNVFTTNTNNTNKDKNPSNSPPEKSDAYYSKLKGLNQSVSNWIKKHVDANPLINLQPIFQDYEKYFAELEKERDLKPPDTKKKTETPADLFVSKPTSNLPDSTTEKSQLDSKNLPNKSTAPKGSFGSSVTSSSASSATPSFSFGNTSNIKASTGSFSVGTATKETASTTNTTPTFSFGVNSSTSKSSEAKTVNTPSFTFGVNSPTTASDTTKPVTTTPSFSFGAQSTNASETSKLFTFGAKSPSVPSSVASSEVTKPANKPQSQITFGIPSSTSSTTKDTTKTIPSFTFGTATSNSSNVLGNATQDTTKSASTTIPSFSFGALPSNSTIPPFSSAVPFTFSNVAKPVSTQDQNNAEEDEEPPKNEFTPVVENDHVYTIRCKVFVKKNDAFGDRGVGNLYLKPIADSEKIQLIVRADTNLGNLLLNLILSQSIPTKRLGKKDVMLVCVPTPDTEPPPVPVLLRVKSPEEADKLLEVLDKHKK